MKKVYKISENCWRETAPHNQPQYLGKIPKSRAQCYSLSKSLTHSNVSSISQTIIALPSPLDASPVVDFASIPSYLGTITNYTFLFFNFEPSRRNLISLPRFKTCSRNPSNSSGFERHCRITLSLGFEPHHRSPLSPLALVLDLTSSFPGLSFTSILKPPLQCPEYEIFHLKIRFGDFCGI